jgi:hypothetical protein
MQVATKYAFGVITYGVSATRNFMKIFFDIIKLLNAHRLITLLKAKLDWVRLGEVSDVYAQRVHG